MTEEELQELERAKELIAYQVNGIMNPSESVMRAAQMQIEALARKQYELRQRRKSR